MSFEDAFRRSESTPFEVVQRAVAWCQTMVRQRISTWVNDSPLPHPDDFESAETFLRWKQSFSVSSESPVYRDVLTLDDLPGEIASSGWNSKEDDIVVRAADLVDTHQASTLRWTQDFEMCPTFGSNPVVFEVGYDCNIQANRVTSRCIWLAWRDRWARVEYIGVQHLDAPRAHIEHASEDASPKGHYRVTFYYDPPDSTMVETRDLDHHPQTRYIPPDVEAWSLFQKLNTAWGRDGTYYGMVAHSSSGVDATTERRDQWTSPWMPSFRFYTSDPLHGAVSPDEIGWDVDQRTSLWEWWDRHHRHGSHLAHTLGLQWDDSHQQETHPARIPALWWVCRFGS